MLYDDACCRLSLFYIVLFCITSLDNLCDFFTCFVNMLRSICFFKQKTADEWRISDWSSDVCSSDLQVAADHVCEGQPDHLGEHGIAPDDGGGAVDVGDADREQVELGLAVPRCAHGRDGWARARSGTSTWRGTTLATAATRRLTAPGMLTIRPSSRASTAMRATSATSTHMASGSGFPSVKSSMPEAWPNSVRTGPGQSAVTVIPNGASSPA